MNQSAFDRITDALEAHGRTVKRTGEGKAVAQCPVHDDTKPSLSIGPRRDGNGIVVYCHAQECSHKDIVAAVGLGESDLFDDDGFRAAYADTATYIYPGGRRVHRKPDKAFPQSGNKEDRSLFHGDLIGDAETIYVTEGEKDVLAIESAGGAAVCPAMGAGKAQLCDWSVLQGKNAILVADKDDAGRKHASQVAGELDGIAASVRIVEAAVGKDAADHIAADLGLDEFVEVEWWPLEQVDGAALLDSIAEWFARFIRVTYPDDIYVLALWTAHTHLVNELRTTPRLMVDSTVFASGKTTVLNHLDQLCHHPVQAAILSSAALVPRLLETSMRTILLDEVDRSLRPDKPGVEDLLAILNSGYKFGATRPVLVPTKGGGWESRDMSTYAPVAMAGNSPRLPADTVSRSIRILLMPDLDGTVEDSDWEAIEDDAKALAADVAAWADQVREQVRGMAVDLPPNCIGRAKEKWRPLKRVAVAAGGRWPGIADRLIAAALAEDEAEREAGLKARPPGMVLLEDLYAVWPQDKDFVATRVLVDMLIAHNPDYWGAGSSYGKPLNEHRFGRIAAQAAKVTSRRIGGGGTPRGYMRRDLDPTWRRLGIAPPHTKAVEAVARAVTSI